MTSHFHCFRLTTSQRGHASQVMRPLEASMSRKHVYRKQLIVFRQENGPH
jgi:hypothetical protein